MKTTIDISKRTKGEWKLSEDMKALIADYPNEICRFNTLLQEYKANAAYICLAVNNFQALVENVARLVDRLEENEMGRMSAVTRAKQLLQSIEQQL